MVQKLRERSQGESGFTLVELLVVMLILGLLAAIAIPSFFNQRDKAKDADAKASARTAQTAIETYATDNGGSYLNADPADLVLIEETLSDATLAVPSATVDTYEVMVTSENTSGGAHTFSIARNAAGAISYTCVAPASDPDGCPTDGNWGD